MQPIPGRNTGAGWSSKKKAATGMKPVVDPRPSNKAPGVKPTVDPGLGMKIQPLKPRSNGGLFGAGGKLVNKVYKTY